MTTFYILQQQVSTRSKGRPISSITSHFGQLPSPPPAPKLPHTQAIDTVRFLEFY